MNIQTIINNIHGKFKNLTDGHPATYIPELAKANPNHFAIVITTVNGAVFKAGDSEILYSMQSTSKPFAYGMVLEDVGRDYILSKVGVEPSGEAFNSIVELEKNTHRPYNPMINSGAIGISSFIKGSGLAAREKHMLEFFSRFLDRNIEVDEKVFLSEKNTAHRNRSIAHLLKHFNVIDGNIDEALDLYFKQCSVVVTTTELSMMAATFANGGVQPFTEKRALKEEFVGDVLALMFTCGMYDTSGKWAYSVGIPAKSGVSGAVFGVVPGHMGIAVYSPPIDEHGHSIRGLAVFEELSRELKLSIFRK